MLSSDVVAMGYGSSPCTISDSTVHTSVNGCSVCVLPTTGSEGQIKILTKTESTTPSCSFLNTDGSTLQATQSDGTMADLNIAATEWCMLVYSSGTWTTSIYQPTAAPAASSAVQQVEHSQIYTNVDAIGVSAGTHYALSLIHI